MDAQDNIDKLILIIEASVQSGSNNKELTVGY
jgi:hypothetical protein